MSGDPTRRKCTCEEHCHGGKYIGLSTWYKHAKFRETEISPHTAPTLHGEAVVEPGPAQASGSGSGNLAPDIEDPEVDDTGLGMDAHEHENDLNDTGTGGQPQDSEMNADAFDGMGAGGHHLDHVTDADEPHDADNEDDAEDNPLQSAADPGSRCEVQAGSEDGHESPDTSSDHSSALTPNPNPTPCSGFIYHPHLRPLTTPIAALASLSATLHSHAPSLLPTPSRVLHAALARAQSPDPRSPSPAPSHTNTPLPSALHALATTLELSPIHVDHVAEAVCRAIERQDVRGPVGLRRMRELIGWGERERGG
ncbi:hypothetical protein JB92DRAFT_3112624 [Gautieria morchelliformis]|nr:hypothetical protein JB92DRAFT_3112624 [Gautieria morchelliformis]